MDLEEITKSLLMPDMDAQNVTAAVMRLIIQLSRDSSIRLRPPTAGEISYDDDLMNLEEDDTEELALNLSSILLSKYQNDSAFLIALARNLMNEEVRWKEEANRRLSDFSATVLITIYLMVIAIGSFGNLLLISAVARQKALRTPRNAFVINLAVSDLLLCLVTIPLTLVEILNDHWPLGDSVVSCKAAGGLQAVSVFVSTISITVIAVDRYQLIVYPTRDLLKKIGAAAGVFFIWVLGFLLAAPIFAVRMIEHYDFNSPRRAPYIEKSLGGVHSVDFCYEKWPVTHGRAIYSALTLVIQYVLPITIISVLYSKIGQRLRIRHTTLESMMVQDSLRRIRETKRLRRRHHLLIAIALVFSIAWLPLNVFNLFIDLYNPFTNPKDEEKMAIIYATCHLIGMSSACANPFLYGWFNDNFRGEFVCILMTPFRFCSGNINVGRFCSCQSQGIRETGPSSNAFNGSHITPFAVIDAVPETIENNRQIAAINMVEDICNAVVSEFPVDQPVLLVSFKIEKEVSIEDQRNVEQQCLPPSSSFPNKSGCLETHL